MIKPYDFQEEILTNIKIAMLEKHKHILIQSPTGSGKTVMFSNIIYGADKKNTKCLIITDRIELLYGSSDTIENFDIETTKILAGAKFPPPNNSYKHVVAMSQTLRRRILKEHWQEFFASFGIIIIDEAHVQEFNIYFEQSAFTNEPYILSFTATPKRLKKQRQLSEDYTKLIIGPQIPDLIKRGFLVPDKYYAPKNFDVSKIGLNSFGDFKENEMFKRFEHTISYSSIVHNWKEIACNTITIVFCSNTEHTLKVCEAFNEAGIKSKFVVSHLSKPRYKDEMTDEQFTRFQEKDKLYNYYQKCMSLYSGNREQVINSWENGEYPVLVNTNIFTKGYDHRPIQTVMVLRATTSESLWLQMIGRGSRTYTNKTHFNLLDFGSNGERLGLYNQEREWSLYGSFSTSEGVAPVKECGIISGKQKDDKNGKKGCGCLILASSKICKYCGYIFEKEKVEIDINLKHIIYAEDDTMYKDINFTELDRIMEERGYKFGWIINQIIAKGGADALKAYRKYKNYDIQWIDRMQKTYSKAIEKYEEMQNEILQESSQSKGTLF